MINNQKKRPLLVFVDDDMNFQWIVRDLLKKKYDVLYYGDGYGFLEELPSLDPDLYILDVTMPGPNGFDLCRRIHSWNGASSAPVLFLTALRGDTDFAKGLMAGGSSYLTKPIQPAVLLETIERLLKVAA